MESLARQLRHAVRKLSRSPLFTVVAIASLAVGIGANTAIFTVVDAVLLEPLPYPDSDRLVWVNFTAPGLGYDEIPFSDGAYVHILEGQHSFEGLELWSETRMSLTSDGPPERLAAARVTPGTFSLLRVHPELGRGFVPEEGRPGAEPSVVLSYGLWNRRFGADPDILDETVRIDGEPRRVVGVAPRRFAYPSAEIDVWVPLVVDEAALSPGAFSFPGIGRLRAGVSMESAEADVQAQVETFSERFPEELPASLLEQARWATRVRPFKERIVGDVRTALWVVLATVTFVLLIVCANVANLFLARTESRTHELAVRTAMGAGRGDLAGGFLSESALLAVAGGALGLPLALLGLRGLVSQAPAAIPRMHEVGLDARVLLFTAVVSVAAGLFFGGFPIFRYRAADLVAGLKEGARAGTEGRERRLARNSLVVLQVALAMSLLVGSGLMIRSFRALRAVEPGFDARGVLTFGLALPEREYRGAAEIARFWRQLADRLRELPGVAAVGAVNHLPLGGGIANGSLYIEDHPVPEGDIPPLSEHKFVTPGYFEAMRIPLLAGRTLEVDDGADVFRAAVVNRSFEEHWWPDGSALGKRVRLREDEDWYEIVGVVGDVRFRSLESPPEDAVYLPILSGSSEDPYSPGGMSFAVRSDADPEAFMGVVRREVWALDPNLPIADQRTMAGILADSMARTSFILVMLGIAAAVALLLGTLGIYGVISYAVSRRTRELGIRMALGATARRVRRAVVAEGLLLAVVGVAIGLAVTLALSGLLSDLLYGVGTMDPVTYGLVPVLLLGAAALASYVPARRASAIDPMEALRQ